MKRSISLTIAVLIVASLVVTPALASTVVTSNGTWTAYPGQAAVYQASVQQPINMDGSSNFKANGKAVIPVKFALSEGLGEFVFESILSDVSADNDFSYVSFTPAAPVKFSEISELSAVYAFTEGNCHGGSLRWSVRRSCRRGPKARSPIGRTWRRDCSICRSMATAGSGSAMKR